MFVHVTLNTKNYELFYVLIIILLHELYSIKLKYDKLTWKMTFSSKGINFMIFYDMTNEIWLF